MLAWHERKFLAIDMSIVYWQFDMLSWIYCLDSGSIEGMPKLFIYSVSDRDNSFHLFQFPCTHPRIIWIGETGPWVAFLFVHCPMSVSNVLEMGPAHSWCIYVPTASSPQSLQTTLCRDVLLSLVHRYLIRYQAAGYDQKDSCEIRNVTGNEV